MTQQETATEPHVHTEHCHHDHISHEPYVRAGAKIGRNDPCPCKSGKKFKKCCGVAKA